MVDSAATIVWLVENDVDMRRMLAGTLAKQALSIEELGDGAQLMGRIRGVLRGEPAPDLLVTDHHLPRVNGLDAVESLRLAGFGLPVVVITAFADGALHLRARQARVWRVLDKPFDLAVFREVCAGAIAAGHEACRPRAQPKQEDSP